MTTQRRATPGPTLHAVLRSVPGPHRRTNEDSAAAARGYAFVADGVGGHAGGDVASAAVTHALTASLATRDVRRLDEPALRELLAVANAELATQTRHDPELRGLATTFTGLFAGAPARVPAGAPGRGATGGVVRVLHVGDSRAYLLRDGRAERVSHDDSYVQLLVDSGALDEAEAWHHPQRNLILGSLTGSARDGERVTVVERDARTGDRWLLCSDGLTDYVPEPDVVALLGSDEDPEVVADRLVAAAMAVDVRDNVTVVVCDVRLPAEDGSGGRGRTRPVVVGAAELLRGALSEARPAS